MKWVWCDIDRGVYSFPYSIGNFGCTSSLSLFNQLICRFAKFTLDYQNPCFISAFLKWSFWNFQVLCPIVSSLCTSILPLFQRSVQSHISLCHSGLKIPDFPICPDFHPLDHPIVLSLGFLLNARLAEQQWGVHIFSLSQVKETYAIVSKLFLETSASYWPCWPHHLCAQMSQMIISWLPSRPAFPQVQTLSPKLSEKWFPAK